MLRQLTIIGIGLIGGSLARALKRAGACARVIGCARTEVDLQRAVELGVIDDYRMEPAAACAGSDMILIAVPLGAMEPVLRAMSGHLSADAVMTDAGSAKGSVVDAARRTLGPDELKRFVPGHPVAGTERSGVEASFAELYEGRRVILTPITETVPEAVEKVQRMWEAAGACVEQMAVAHHDEVLAATSHLPHVLAYSLVECLATMQESREIFRFAAGGFADFTRIASSSPRMWHDIVFANREAILSVLALFEGHLDQLIEAIRSNDSERVMRILTRAKEARDRFAANHSPRAGGE